MTEDMQGLLKSVFGHERFREGQQSLIDELLRGRDVLGVMPTGAGKSVCYQLPALKLDGVALVISPLISLMTDQVMALKASGVAAAYINSSLTPGQQAEAIRRASLGAYRIIYVAPERLDAPQFAAFAREAKLSLVAVDEAHCVSQWGQDFRPSYLRIADFVAKLPSRPPVGAFTATATKRVRDDIVRLLELRDPYCLVSGYDRPNLHFTSVKPSSKLSMLLSFLDGMPSDSGIVYCSTRKTVEDVTQRLRDRGISATRYHAGLADEERRRNQDDFQYDRARVMVATNAFGMGIDKSNVRFVVHYNMPKNIESYYQEAGRAGRDGGAAECMLLYSGQDVHTARWMIEHSDENPDLTQEQRAERVRRDFELLKQMTFYATSKDCLRRFILRYFGERDVPERCDNCSVCEGAEFEVDTGTAAIAMARARTRGQKPRARAKADPTAELTELETALYNDLRELRMRIAVRKKLPAYLVFSDQTLHDMALLHPSTPDSFLRVSGVGESKRAEYGESFLAAIRPYGLPDQTLAQDAPAAREAAPPPPEQAGSAWTTEEDERLRDEYEGETPLREMMDAHGRTRGAILSRLRKLGIIEG